MLRVMVSVIRRLQLSCQHRLTHQPAALLAGVAATILLTLMIVYPAVMAAAPSSPSSLSAASPLSTTGPASSFGPNAAKRNLHNDNNNDISMGGDGMVTSSNIVRSSGSNEQIRLFPGNVGAALRSASFSTQSTTPSNTGNGNGKLISIQIVHRHGARSPLHPPPNQKKQWRDLKLAFGQLTDRGRYQHAAFGRALRAKYIPAAEHSFLPTTNPSTAEVSVRSSDVDRCLVSVQSLLQGLWPNSMLPVHTIAEDTETLLQPTDKCVSYRSNHVLAIDRWSEVAKKEHAELLTKLKEITGFSIIGDDDSKDKPADEVVRAGSLISVSVDNIQCATTQGLPLDEYLTPQVLTTMRDFTFKMFMEQYGMKYDGTNDDTHDSRGGPATHLARLILGNFKAKSSTNAPTTKLSIFSAHDTTLLALAASLGLLRTANDWLLPSFAGSMIFELRQEQSQYYVHAYQGHPEPVPDGDPSTPDGWTYKIEPMKLRCENELEDRCKLDRWEKKVLAVNPVPSMSSGCCERSEGFFKLGCDNYTRAYSELPRECQVYRRVCPISSCGDNQVMNAATLSCIDIDDEEPIEAKSIGIGFMAAGALLCIIAVISRLRSKIPSVRSLDGSAQYTPVLTLRR